MAENLRSGVRLIPALWTPLLLVLFPASSSVASPGCLVTFRHGETVPADQCDDLGHAVAYVRFGGWMVVPKSMLASVEDETGVKRLNPRWTPEEERAQLQAVPREGGVPIGPPAPETPLAPPLPSQTVVYVPVPSPAPPQIVYQVVPQAVYYPPFVVFCPHCLRPHSQKTSMPTTRRIVPTSPSDIGPMAIQKTFPPISPIR